jgi:hypothetical protein
MMEYFCNRSVDLYSRGSNLNKCRSRFPRRLRHLNGTPAKWLLGSEPQTVVQSHCIATFPTHCYSVGNVWIVSLHG